MFQAAGGCIIDLLDLLSKYYRDRRGLVMDLSVAKMAGSELGFFNKGLITASLKKHIQCEHAN